MSGNPGAKYAQDVKGGFETTHVTARTPDDIHKARLTVATWALDQPDPHADCTRVLDMLGILGRDDTDGPAPTGKPIRKPHDPAWPISAKHGTTIGLRAHEVRRQAPCGPCRAAGERRDAALREVTS